MERDERRRSGEWKAGGRVSSGGRVENGEKRSSGVQCPAIEVAISIRGKAPLELDRPLFKRIA